MKLMFSVRVEDKNPVHTRVKVYNYGGLSGTVVLNTSDAEEFMKRISKPSPPPPAPDAALLAALKRLMAWWDGGDAVHSKDHDVAGALDIIRAAIAQAETAAGD